MKALLPFVLFVAWVLSAPSAPAQSPLGADQLSAVEFHQNLGAQLPLNLPFRDESGAPVRLGACFGERPVVVVFAYFSCPNLCHVVLDGTLESLRQLTWSVGQEFDVVVASIDPLDTPATARARRVKMAARYGRPGRERGWHFLTGEADSIRALADAAGFRYRYDPSTQQYAHASGLLIATPQGKVSRYFLGIEFPAVEMRAALADAGQQRVGSLAERLLLLCFHYDPRSGRHGPLITRIVQVAGFGTVGALGLLVFRLSRPRARPS